jgi:hypothetical protein
VKAVTVPMQPIAVLKGAGIEGDPAKIKDRIGAATSAEVASSNHIDVELRRQKLDSDQAASVEWHGTMWQLGERNK